MLVALSADVPISSAELYSSRAAIVAHDVHARIPLIAAPLTASSQAHYRRPPNRDILEMSVTW